MTNLRSSAGAALLVASLSAPVACGAAFTSGSAGDDAGADSSAVDGPGFDGAAEGDTSPADATGDSAPGRTIFVSAPRGDDKNDGLSSSRPKKTIVAGLAAAATLGTGAEVHVCAGSYAESGLAVTTDVSLQGSYDCATWKRSSTYGFPAFAMATLSTITNGNATQQPSTLAFTGPNVSAATVIDGFAIAGTSSTAAASYAVNVEDAASPVIRNVFATGGSGKAGASGTAGSVGVRIGGSSSAELTLSSVVGGAGSGPVGSVGVLLDSTGAPSVHDLIASGGTGTPSGAMPDLASAGVEIVSSLDSSKPLSRAIVTGSDAAGVAGTSAGVLVLGNGITATISGCEVLGGTGSMAGTASIGVDVSTTGSVIIADDRIYGGQRTGGSSHTFGVLVSLAGGLAVLNTEIHSGSVPVAAGEFGVGIDITSTTAPVIQFDTIYTGSGAGTDVALNDGVTGARITDDILVGSEAPLGTYGLAATSCAAGTFATLDHTAFGNLAVLYSCGSGTSNTTITTIAQLLTTFGPQAAGDVAFQSSCVSGDITCAQAKCPGSSCLPSIFGASWSSDDGVSGLLGTAGADGGLAPGAWSLAPGTSCRVASGGTTITGIPTDLLGTTRGSTPTMGAVEYASATPCAN